MRTAERPRRQALGAAMTSRASVIEPVHPQCETTCSSASPVDVSRGELSS